MTRLGKMPSDWAKELAPVLESENFKRLEDFIIQAYEKGPVYPDQNHIYAAFEHTPFDQVKVVILGQRPLPSTRSSARIEFFSQQRCEDSTFFTKYL